MATPSAPSNRASLLAGLRTGGVRSASQPLQVPHTAAPAGSFTIPRIVSSDYSSSNYFPEESEEDDQLVQLAAQSLNLNHNPRHSGIPMTANAADGAMMLQQQQQQLFLRQLAAQQRGGGMYQDQAEVQAQLMQMELLRLQAIQQAQQAQQFQAELYAQAQRQQVNGRGNLRRTSMEPMTAAPSITTFDQRANAAAQLRARAQQAEYRAAMQNNVDDYGPVPMTAAIGGKFGSRGLNPHANSFVAGGFGQMEQQADIYAQNNYMNAPPTPGRVISGGISLGNPNGSTPPPVSKSDAATSWRRTGNNSVLRSASSPLNTKLHRSSPSNDESSPTTKARPKPLKFNSVDSMAIPTVTIDTSNVDEETSSSSSKGGSPTSASGPATPPSSDTSLTGVESKKSYDGLGIGRQAPVAPAPRHVSMPLRQPKGPPSGADELGPRNFATRLRKQAIGGLGVLVNARERREVAAEVQAF